MTNIRKYSTLIILTMKIFPIMTICLLVLSELSSSFKISFNKMKLSQSTLHGQYGSDRKFVGENIYNPKELKSSNLNPLQVLYKFSRPHTIKVSLILIIKL